MKTNGLKTQKGLLVLKINRRRGEARDMVGRMNDNA